MKPENYILDQQRTLKKEFLNIIPANLAQQEVINGS